VVTCIDLLLGRRESGETVIVIGGGLVGCETALWLAQNGKKVTIVEMLPDLLLSNPPIPHMNRIMLLDLLPFYKVEVLKGTKLQEVTDKGAVVSGNGSGKKLIEADNVVLASGLESDNALYKELTGKVARLYAIGDCREPRNIMGAVWDAYELGRTI
jgi:2-enoate reductase